MPRTTSTLASGFGFPESPRWQGGLLYVSDMGTRAVVSVEVTSGTVTTVVPRVPGAPSGLAWDDEGRLLVVSMARSVVLRDDGAEQLTIWADLAPFGGGWRNDAVRHPEGWLYVGAVGDDDGLADLVVVDRQGRVRVAASALSGPNGMVVAPDRRTLVVAEHTAGRLTAFPIAADGALGQGRTWAEAQAWLPDVCCADREGALWVASAGSTEVRRLSDGGTVLDRVTASQPAFACMLGGPDRRTLFLCTAPGSDETSRSRRAGRVEAVRVDVPGAGWP